MQRLNGAMVRIQRLRLAEDRPGLFFLTQGQQHLGQVGADFSITLQ